MLTLARIAELRAGAVPILDEYAQLLDAAEAWELVRLRRYLRGTEWLCDEYGRARPTLAKKGTESPTPQAAVLAALKGETK